VPPGFAPAFCPGKELHDQDAANKPTHNLKCSGADRSHRNLKGITPGLQIQMELNFSRRVGGRRSAASSQPFLTH